MTCSRLLSKLGLEIKKLVPLTQHSAKAKPHLKHLDTNEAPINSNPTNNPFFSTGIQISFFYGLSQLQKIILSDKHNEKFDPPKP